MWKHFCGRAHSRLISMQISDALAGPQICDHIYTSQSIGVYHLVGKITMKTVRATPKIIIIDRICNTSFP